MKHIKCFASIFLSLIFLLYGSICAGDTLRVMTYNLQGMKPGTGPETRLQYIIEKLKEIDPDIIGLQEINEDVNGDGSDNQGQRIADALSEHFQTEYNFYQTQTHLSWDNQFNEYIGIITKHPVERSGSSSLVQGVFPRKVAWNLIDTQIGKVNFFNTHLSYNSESVRVQQVEQVKSFAKSMSGIFESAAVIITGDFNSTPETEPIQIMTDTEAETYYISTFAEANPGIPGYTVPANSPDSKIDYVFMKAGSEFSIVDSKVEMNEPYSANVYMSDHLAVVTRFVATTTDIGENETQNAPKDFQLMQNYPNPFNPITTIKYEIPAVGTSRDLSLQTRLIVYDTLGREITTLVNSPKPPGTSTVTFDASDLPSGVYYYRLQAGTFTQTKKLILLK